MVKRALIAASVLVAGLTGGAVVAAPIVSTIPIGKTPTTGSPSFFYISNGANPFTSPVITANFGDGFSGAVDFDDSFTFTIPTESGFGSGSISTSFSGNMNLLTINQLLINNVPYAVPLSGAGQSTTVGGIPITAGVLNTIRVVGTSSSLGGTYSGTMTFNAVADVPEASTWCMMIAGFGLIGAAMRRHRTSVTFA